MSGRCIGAAPVSATRLTLTGHLICFRTLVRRVYVGFEYHLQAIYHAEPRPASRVCSCSRMCAVHQVVNSLIVPRLCASERSGRATRANARVIIPSHCVRDSARCIVTRKRRQQRQATAPRHWHACKRKTCARSIPLCRDSVLRNVICTGGAWLSIEVDFVGFLFGAVGHACCVLFFLLVFFHLYLHK